MTDVVHLSGTVIVDSQTTVNDLWVVDGKIRLSKPTDIDGAPAPTVTGFIAPGLVDAHCHIGLGAARAVTPAEAEAQALADRSKATLLIRDAGSPIDTHWVDQRADLPKIIRAGRHLARPKRYLRGFSRELDDVSELPQAVREEAARGDGWVKLVGDWIDRSMGADADLTPLWPIEVLRDAVAAAHDAGARVTVHTFAPETIDDVFDASIDCIEHGTGMTPDQMLEAARRGVPVTVTAMQTAYFDDFADQAGARFPVYAQRMREMHARRDEHIQALNEAGVPLLMGSDAGGTINHGSLPDELAACVAAGLPDDVVFAAASHGAREYFGAPGIAEGAPADLVVYRDDPRQDVAVTQSPQAIFLRGAQVF